MKKTELKIGMVFEEWMKEQCPVTKRFHVVTGMRRDANRGDACAEVALITIGRARTLPFVLKWEDFHARVTSGVFAHTTQNASPLAVLSLADVPVRRRKKFSNKRDANAALIKPILELGWGAFVNDVRGALIAKIASGHFDGKTRSASWIRELLIAYWRSGGNDLALGPDYTNCGAPTRAERRRRANASGEEIASGRRPGAKIKIVAILEPGAEVALAADELGRGGCAIPPDAEPIIQNLINYYLGDKMNKAIISISLDRRNALPWTAIKEHVHRGLRDYPKFALLKPSRRQVQYIGRQSVNVMAMLRNVKGSRETNLNNRAQSGDYRDVALFAGHRYEIDIAISDIHLVDNITGLNIGRVFIIYVVDRYSGMIVGVYVTTDNVTYAHIGRALHCAYSNKTAWCKSIGYNLAPKAWDCEGKSDELVADNAQLASIDGGNLAEEITDLGLTRAYRGDDKPQVETSFELTNHGYVHAYSLGVTKGPKQRAKDDPSKAAYVSMSTFTRELVRWVVEVANHRPLPLDRVLDVEFVKTRKAPTPFNLWKWSADNLGGPPNIYVPAIMMPRLLRRAEAKITAQGILLGTTFFDLPKDNNLQEAKALTTFSGRVTIPVYYDELSTRQIYLAPEDPTAVPLLCPISHLSRDNADRCFKEVDMQSDFRKGLNKAAEDAYAARKDPQHEAQRAAAEQDLDKIKTQHGSFKARNKVAAGYDKQVVRDAHGEADGTIQETVMHGPPPTCTPNSTPSTTASNAPVRPSSYE
ncbi:MAG: hypothetical protein PSV13_03055 [Lacunisphaera sp.]|nr:hypothetical protein [Lacunisphaera sp.]